jgi:hypothetical protein
MIVLIGNPVRPDAVTEIRVPDEFDLEERFANLLGALNFHLRDGDRPVWVESDDLALKTLIEAHYAKEY